MMMEAQLERTRKETEENRAATQRVNDALIEVDYRARKVKESEMEDRKLPVVNKKEEEEAAQRRKDAQGWQLIMDAVQ
jgi:hypothetical protein